MRVCSGYIAKSSSLNIKNYIVRYPVHNRDCVTTLDISKMNVYDYGIRKYDCRGIVNMISKYGIFCKVVEIGNFTRVAEMCGYSQSAVSQTIKSLEQELGFRLIDRRKDGIRLTADGEQFFLYIKAVYTAEKELEQKQKEMNGLINSTVHIGTFTGVSRNLLPPLMKSFKDTYPNVSFVLRQGEYTSIAEWIKEGNVDFGFVNQDAVSGVETKALYEERMMAVLPVGHPLARKKQISLEDLLDEPLILLDEGSYSVPMTAFRGKNIVPNIAYEVYDDYTILSMVRQKIGVSLMYERVLDGFEADLVIRPLEENPYRTVALAWRNRSTMSKASKLFAEYIEKHNG